MKLLKTKRPTLVVHGIYEKCNIPRKGELPVGYSLEDLQQDQIMVRRRLRGLKNRFVPEQGLVSESKLATFHIENDQIYEERSVLVQSFEHYQKLKDHAPFSKLFPEHLDEILDDVRFGENMIVSGLDNTQICIGDIFEVQGGTSSLRLQVSSPRLPCSYVDKKNGSPFGTKGIRRYTASHGLAGWFVRVLQSGTIEEGTRLVRVANPHPKWTLEYISKTLYAEVDRKHFIMCTAQWARSKEELEELCALPALGWYEWKAQAQSILDRWGRADVMVEPNKIIDSDSPLTVQVKQSAAAAVSLPIQLGRSSISSFCVTQIVPCHLEKRFSHWIAIAIFGLAWLAVGMTVVLKDFPDEMRQNYSS
ncbi:MOSC domain containing protein [Nitzschia inconspicua]|uniref:MOSC domain containing protein n=1 Tax=Nitzschia inconspicua TaxID=303405 RepID=A0A9K3KZA1_9STRA|nr:MOSC domain containing protein [Nitzschia inconspicua]